MSSTAKMSSSSLFSRYMWTDEVHRTALLSMHTDASTACPFLRHHCPVRTLPHLVASLPGETGESSYTCSLRNSMATWVVRLSGPADACGSQQL